MTLHGPWVFLFNFWGSFLQRHQWRKPCREQILGWKAFWSCLKPESTHAQITSQSISVHGRHGFDVRIGMSRVHDPSYRLEPSFDVSMWLNVIEYNHWDRLRRILNMIWFNIRMHSVVAQTNAVFASVFNSTPQPNMLQVQHLSGMPWRLVPRCDTGVLAEIFCYIKVGQFWNLLQTRRCSKTRCWSVS